MYFVPEQYVLYTISNKNKKALTLGKGFSF